MSIPRQSSVWDERRNSSRVFAVPPDALPAALRALASLRRGQPELVRWIEDGHPTLTEAEHVARFGEAYMSTRPRARAWPCDGRYVHQGSDRSGYRRSGQQRRCGARAGTQVTSGAMAAGNRQRTRRCWALTPDSRHEGTGRPLCPRFAQQQPRLTYPLQTPPPSVTS